MQFDIIIFDVDGDGGLGLEFGSALLSVQFDWLVAQVGKLIKSRKAATSVQSDLLTVKVPFVSKSVSSASDGSRHASVDNQLQGIPQVEKLGTKETLTQEPHFVIRLAIDNIHMGSIWQMHLKDGVAAERGTRTQRFGSSIRLAGADIWTPFELSSLQWSGSTQHSGIRLACCCK